MKHWHITVTHAGIRSEDQTFTDYTDAFFYRIDQLCRYRDHPPETTTLVSLILCTDAACLADQDEEAA